MSKDKKLIFSSHVLSSLHNRGWFLLTSTDVSKKQLDKDTLIFILGVPPPCTSFFAVSFNDYDKLRLIEVPVELIEPVQQILGSDTIQKEDWKENGLYYQIKLYEYNMIVHFVFEFCPCFFFRRGSPWMPHGDETVSSRLILLSLLDCFSKLGWKLHASIDISQGHEGRDTDSWFLRRED